MCDLDRQDAERRRSDAGEGEGVLGHKDLGLSENRIAKGDVHAERVAVELAGQPTRRPKSEPFVLPAVVLDLRVILVGRHLEGHEVAEVATARLLKTGEQLHWSAHYAQVHVLRAPRLSQAELEHEAALQCHRIAEDRDDSREEAVEHQ